MSEADENDRSHLSGIEGGKTMDFCRKMFTVLLILQVLAMPLVAQEIMQAVRQGDLARVKSLIEANPELLNTGDQRQCRPIHWATNDGRIEIVRWLLDQGADITVRDADGDTPIYWSADAGRTEIAKILMAHGAIRVDGVPGDGISGHAAEVSIRRGAAARAVF